MRTNGGYPHRRCPPPSLTPPADAIAFAHLAQSRCIGRGMPTYVSELALLVLTGSERGLGAPPDALQNLLMSERERGLFGRADLADAARALGLGPGGMLGALAEDAEDAFLAEDAEDAFLANTLASVLRAVSTQPEGNAALDAYCLLAQARRSSASMAEHALRRARGWMTLDAAYRALRRHGRHGRQDILAAHMDVRGARVCAQVLC
jgi:hypothetical protein